MRACVNDGMLDVISLGEAGAWRRMRLFAAAFSGSHVREPEVRSARAVEATLRFPAPPLFDADGELRQAAGRDVRIECIPAALRMVVAD